MSNLSTMYNTPPPPPRRCLAHLIKRGDMACVVPDAGDKIVLMLLYVMSSVCIHPHPSPLRPSSTQA